MATLRSSSYFGRDAPVSAPIIKGPIVSSIDVPCCSSEEMEVQLVDAKPLYTNLDCINGMVTHSHSRSHREHSLHVQLQGVARVSNSQWSQSGYETSKTTWSFLCPSMEVQLGDASLISPFSIRIPQTLQPYQCPLGEACHLELPPTLTSKTSANFKASDIDWQVEYQIVVELRLQGANDVVECSTIPIMFAPQAKVPRLLAVTQDQAASDLFPARICNIFGQKLGLLTLLLPRERVVRTSATNMATTSTVDLCFFYKGRIPPQITQIGMSLDSRTYRRLTHQHSKNRIESSYLVSHDLPCMKLCQSNSQWSQSHTELRVWTLRLALPITVGSSSEVMLPSFESCLISRRYEFHMTLSLSAQSSIALRTIQHSFPLTLETHLQPTTELASSETITVPSYEDAVAVSPSIAPMLPVPVYRDAIPSDELERVPSWAAKSNETLSICSDEPSA